MRNHCSLSKSEELHLHFLGLSKQLQQTALPFCFKMEFPQSETLAVNLRVTLKPLISWWCMKIHPSWILPILPFFKAQLSHIWNYGWGNSKEIKMKVSREMNGSISVLSKMWPAYSRWKFISNLGLSPPVKLSPLSFSQLCSDVLAISNNVKIWTVTPAQ